MYIYLSILFDILICTLLSMVNFIVIIEYKLNESSLIRNAQILQ